LLKRDIRAKLEKGKIPTAGSGGVKVEGYYTIAKERVLVVLQKDPGGRHGSSQGKERRGPRSGGGQGVDQGTNEKVGGLNRG
jgi:hypothetical protein